MERNGIESKLKREFYVQGINPIINKIPVMIKVAYNQIYLEV
jgi:hypothetical protein